MSKKRKEIARNWYRLKAPSDAGAAAEVYIYGEIGWEVTADQFVQDLREIAGPTTPLTVFINSPGGSVWDGLAIHNTLKRRPANVTVHVDGIALSMASAIAMAGDFVVMPENALMMIHDPSWMAIGTADDMRKQADVLDQIRDSLVSIYTSKTGKSADDIKSMMAEETWMTGSQAVENGFADEAVEEVTDLAACAAGFDLSNCRHVPEDLRGWSARAAAANSAGSYERKEDMPDKKQDTASQPDTPAVKAKSEETPKTEVSATPVDTVDASAARREGAQDERERAKAIRAAVRAAKLEPDFADTLIDEGVSVDQALARIIDHWAGQDTTPEPRSHSPITVTGDAVDRFRMGAEKALLAKASMDGGERNEFSGMTLRELARAALNVRNINVSGQNAIQMVGLAFAPSMAGGQHTTSDFANILANVANKAMLKGFDEAEETFHRWTAKGVLTDFKPQTRVDMGLFDSLPELPEGAEYTFGSFGDRGETIQLATYGRKFSITRQAIINDDIAAFTRVPMKMGRAAIRTIGNLVYAVLTANGAMSDGIALFHADHKNLAGTAGAPSTSTLDAMRTAMGTQSDPDSKASGGLNISPAYVIVPKALEGTAKTAMESEYDTAKGDKRLPNSVRGMAEVIADGRLDTNSTTAWYGAASPSMFDTIEVAYLDGVEQPYLETRQGWDVDGVEFKVRHDAGVKALDHRGLYKNAGS